MHKIFTKVIAAVASAVIAIGYAGTLAGAPVNAITAINYEDYYADYTEINYVSHLGSDVRLYIDGDSIGVESSSVTNVGISLREDGSNRPVSSQSRSSEFSYSPAGDMQTGKIYSLDFSFTADGISQDHASLYIALKEDGNLTFVKSLIYDFNVERTSEWWTDEQSLQECLQPQNDVECDDPMVIAWAQLITQGCTNDWEKAYAIYQYLIDEFAYDNVQLEDESISYQDDALRLLRRKITICEGYGNTFTALCRAVGVPACVSFGIGGDPVEFTHDTAIINNEWPNHAWAAVCLGGNWYSVDPTWDCGAYYEGNSFYGGRWEAARPTFDWYLVPLEDFSMSHKICDADTTHGIETTGSCGDNSTYEITRDGTITFYGTGEICLPEGVNGFRNVAFAPDSNITSIGRECFIDCDIITSVILPDTVVRIEPLAFNTCEDLEYVYLPDGLLFIGQEAFDYCDELAYIYVPDSVTTIDTYAFDDCQRLIISVPAHLRGFEDGNYLDPARIIVRES